MATLKNRLAVLLKLNVWIRYDTDILSPVNAIGMLTYVHQKVGAASWLLN